MVYLISLNSRVKFLLIYDSYSGYIDFHQLQNQTSAETVYHLKVGLRPMEYIAKTLRTDNGTQYTPRELKNFHAK